MEARISTKTTFFTKDFLLLVSSSILFFSSMYLILNDLPSYVLSLGGTEADIGLATAAFVISGLSIRPFVGWMIDHWGRKPVLLLGNLIFAVAPLLYVLPGNVFALIVIRMIHGFGLSLFTTAGLTIVTDIVSNARWGEATGFFLSAQLVAISIAPGIGSVLAGGLGLRRVVLYSAVIGLASLILASLVKSYYSISHEIDSPLAYFQKIANNSGVKSAVVAASTVGLGYSTIITFLPHLVSNNGWNGASLFYFIYAAIAILVRAPAGKISDRIGRYNLIFPTVALTVVALAIISLTQSTIWIVIAAILYGLGFGSAYPIIGALAADFSPNETRGTVMGLYGGGFDIGLLIGTLLGGFVGTAIGIPAIFAIVAVTVAIGLIFFGLMKS